MSSSTTLSICSAQFSLWLRQSSLHWHKSVYFKPVFPQPHDDDVQSFFAFATQYFGYNFWKDIFIPFSFHFATIFSNYLPNYSGTWMNNNIIIRAFENILCLLAIYNSYNDITWRYIRKICALAACVLGGSIFTAHLPTTFLLYILEINLNKSVNDIVHDSP